MASSTVDKNMPLQFTCFSLPGVPTTILVIRPPLFFVFPPATPAFFNSFICPSFGTPPKTATLAMLKGLPSSDRVSWVCTANSLVGATTRIDTPPVVCFWAFRIGCDHAGISSELSSKRTTPFSSPIATRVLVLQDSTQ